MAMNMGKVVLVLLLVWLIVLILMTGSLFPSGEPNEHTLRRLTKALNELEVLKKQNQELKQLVSEIRSYMKNDQRKVQNNSGMDDKSDTFKHRLDTNEIETNKAHHKMSFQEREYGLEPTFEHEVLLRKIENNAIEFWYYLKSELKKMLTSTENDRTSAKIKEILEDSDEQQRSLLVDLKNLSMIDGVDEWRWKESQALGDLVQRRLHYLQNPKDCSKAKKLICNINKGCGYGCQLHHVVYCFLVAYGTQRTLILDSKNWRYSAAGWEAVFQPVSETCKDSSGTSRRSWGVDEESLKNFQVVDLPIVDTLRPRPPYLPLSIPEDLSKRMIHFHGYAPVWWIGQFVKYLTRPQQTLVKMLDEIKEKMSFQRPIVGIHVRRTDKVGTEASFHDIDEYMEHVIDYYKYISRTQKIERRRVFIATDDANVIIEARNKYPDFDILGDSDIAKTASVGQRYSDHALRGIIADIHFLSLSDYLVCTFSSQVCRVAYELMQTYHADASSYYHSLDDIYYFGGQNAHNQVAIYKHSPRNEEIPLEPGDMLGIAGNHWNGFSKGTNYRTGQVGLYPSYKVREQIDIVKFPTYSEMDDH